MRFSTPPNLQTSGRLILVAIAVTLTASVGLVLHSNSLTKTLGDPDDAMRLVLVRDLLSGRGWFDQLIQTLQPPKGVFLHWSRLLDGALAVVIRVFEIALPPAEAEAAMRMFWPLLWIFPATLCALIIARRLGGSLPVFICAVLLASNQQAFSQFIPGRIDHHNIQIVMTLAAVACAMAQQNREIWALGAGAATGLGLAVGIEALPFHILVGMSYGFESITNRDARAVTRNYGLSLLGASLFFYSLQTPPWRWALSFCDAIGLNLVTAVSVFACGLITVTVTKLGRSPRARLLILAATVFVAAGMYFALDPLCIGGPFAAVDSRIRPFWFNMVDEMQPMSVIIGRYWDLGISLAFLSSSVIACIALILVRARQQGLSTCLLVCALATFAVVVGFQAFRMESYVFWLGFPVLAAGMAVIATSYLRGLMVPTVIFCVLLSPVGIRSLARAESAAFGHSQKPLSVSADPDCHDTREYLQLRNLPPGLVLADISMGPFILANTPHSVVSAPYHRMVWGVLAAHDALTATRATAEGKFRKLRIDYLVECPSNARNSPPGSLEWDLSQGTVPKWLQPLSSQTQLLQIYRVRPS